MTSKNLESNSNVSNNEQVGIELVDIEDIIPSYGGNSLFLCLSRFIIYMSDKNPTFSDALELCCGISKSDMKCDIQLQAILRRYLCEYWCDNCVIYDQNKNILTLSEEYSK